jgi:hypothetical protein
MNIKTIIGAGFAAFVLAGAPSMADAKRPPRSFFGFDDSPFGEHCVRIVHHYHCHSHVIGGDVSSHRLSCNEARFRVRERGFKKITTRDCSGKSYSFTASKNGARYLVKVNAHTGRVKASAL